LHSDDLVDPSLPAELDHRLADLVAFLDFAILEKDPEVGYGEVAQQSSVLSGDDGQMGIVPFEGCQESMGYRVGGIAG